MARRPKTAATLCCDVSESELAVVHELMAMCRWTSYANVIRAGLYTLAEEQGFALPVGVFDPREHAPTAFTPRRKPVLECPEPRRVSRRMNPPRPTKRHPWQEQIRASIAAAQHAIGTKSKP